MSNSYVRIYDKPNNGGKPATWLGLSATPMHDLQENEPEFFAFFQKNGHTISEVDPTDFTNAQRIRSLGGVSWKYFQVEPPLSEELFSDLGELCAKYVDPGDDSAFLVDNRSHPYPLTTTSIPARLVHTWE